MTNRDLYKVCLLSAIILLAVPFAARSSPGGEREQTEEGEKRRKKSKRCADCYVPLANGHIPFSTVRSASQVMMDFNWQTQSSGPISANYLAFGLGGEVAPTRSGFAIGARLGMDVRTISYGSESDSKAGVRSVDFGVKGTPYDDGRGKAFAIGAKLSIANAEAEGFNADAGAVGGGVMGSIAEGRFRFVGMLAGMFQFPIDERLKEAGLVQWAIQPGMAVSGPHTFAILLNGSLVIGETYGGDVDFRHFVDLMFGYIKGGGGLQASFMIGVPLNHTDSRADFGIFATVGWAM